LDPTLTQLVEPVGCRGRALIDLPSDRFEDRLGRYQEV
jgi:hypothetical protein